MINHYPFAPEKIEKKREMLYQYQLKIADRYNIPICNLKKIVQNFLIKKNMLFFMKACNFT